MKKDLVLNQKSQRRFQEFPKLGFMKWEFHIYYGRTYDEGKKMD